MDWKDTEKVLALRARLHEVVKIRKGKERTAEHHRTREELLHYFTAKRAKARRAQPDLRMTVISDFYQPSLTPVHELKKIFLSDLRLDTRHEGSVVIVRTLGHAIEFSDIQTFIPIEDESNNVDRLAILKFGLATWPSEKLPAAAVMAIKEPVYRSAAENWGMVLGVSHPSDVIFLDLDHPLFPQYWKSSVKDQEKTASEWKIEGNAALKKRWYTKANEW